MMYKLLGTPNEKIWPGFDKLPKFGSYRMSANQPYNYLQTEFNRLSTAGVDLLNRLLTYDPRRRCTAAQALEHGYFQEHPRPKRVEEMPTFPSLHDVLAPVSGGGDVSGRLTGHVDGAPAAGGVGGGSSTWDRPDAPLPRGGLKRKRPGGFGQPDRYGSVF
jgi:serine/threonine protein kinase